MSAGAADEPGQTRTPKPWSLARIVVVGTVAALILGAFLGQTFAWLVAEDASWWNPWPMLSSSQLYDVVRSDIAAVALVGAGGGALIAYRRQRTAEDQHHLERQRHGLAEGADLRERYTTAAEQLGHDKAAVRLAGVYAMAELADEWSRRESRAQRQVCIDVLCAYLRMPGDGAPADQEAEVRDTVVRVLRQHLLDPASRTAWCDADIDLTRAALHNASFQGAVFSGEQTSFAEASFSGEWTSFDGATFSGESASFGGATFSGKLTSFDKVTFSGAWTNFGGAAFSGEETSFKNATFSGEQTNFGGAAFSGERTNFDSATFSRGTNFGEAIFSGELTSFDKVTFSGAWTNFGGAAFSGKGTSFKDATFSGEQADFGRTSFSGEVVSFDWTSFSGELVSFDEAIFSARSASFLGMTLSNVRMSLDTAHFHSPPDIREVGIHDRAVFQAPS